MMLGRRHADVPTPWPSTREDVECSRRGGVSIHRLIALSHTPSTVLLVRPAAPDYLCSVPSMQTAMCNRLAVPAQLQRPSSLSGLRPRLAVAARPLAIAPRAAQDGPPKTVRAAAVVGRFRPSPGPQNAAVHRHISFAACCPTRSM